eukprot:821355-Amphidinium_carterae.1
MAEHRVAILSEATSKKSPRWSAEQKEYPFTDYMKDVALWTQITDLRITQQGPALALQLRREARELLRALDAGELANGKVDPLTGTALSKLRAWKFSTGVEVLLHELHTSLGPMA